MSRDFLSCGPLAARDGEGRSLFDAVEVRLAESYLTVLEGPSGCGKTTLLRQIAGLQPAQGIRRFLAGDEHSASSMPGWRARVTLLAQDAPMLQGSILDNLRFPFDQAEAGERSFDETAAVALLSDFGLDEKLDREVRNLSGGERHRLALVRGLLWDPPVLLADEAFSGLDESAARRCFEILAKQARRPGRAVLCVLHHQNLAGGADRRMRLANGRLEVM